MTVMRLKYSAFAPPSGLEPNLPFAPLTLSFEGRVWTGQALLDTGSSLNVLPYEIGAALGLDWQAQTYPLPIGSWLRGLQAFGVVLTGQIEPFAPVTLLFGWIAPSPQRIPLILGQANFFHLFDLLVSGDRQECLLAPKGELYQAIAF